MSVWALIVAAGKGERAGLGYNKAFYPMRGGTVLSACLDALERSNAFDGSVVVISEADRDKSDEILAHSLVKKVVYGGATRQESVKNGLNALGGDADIVAVHDAARPYVTDDVIWATINSAREYGSGVISTPVTDTIKQTDADGGVTTLDRNMLRAVQTPQTFRVDLLLRAHENAERDGFVSTDDAALFEHYYGSVRLVTSAGAIKNKKLTTKADFEIMPITDMRIGSGYDAHRLVEDRKLILCGVDVPHTRGLLGHSDADVALHALIDALLGAIGEGDIGRHFPDSDMRYKGISSMLLLDEVMKPVRQRGWRVVNADVTIVAQKPKLAKFIPTMRENVARALGVTVERANVKATTTEHMGFEGEELGISASAVVLLAREAE